MVYFQVLRDILKEVQGNMVPRSMLKEWALHTFPNATDYWTFRKMFTIQLALIGLAEFMLHLNRLNPEMLQIAQVGNARKHTQTAMCWTSYEGEREISLTRANSIDIHTLRCINRSPLPSPYQTVWITILPHDIHARPISQPAAVNAKDVLTERYIQSHCSAIKDVSIWRGHVCVRFHTSVCCSGSAGGFLKVIIKDDCVSRPPLPSDPNRPLLTGVPPGS